MSSYTATVVASKLFMNWPIEVLLSTVSIYQCLLRNWSHMILPGYYSWFKLSWISGGQYQSWQKVSFWNFELFSSIVLWSLPGVNSCWSKSDCRLTADLLTLPTLEFWISVTKRFDVLKSILLRLILSLVHNTTLQQRRFRLLKKRVA